MRAQYTSRDRWQLIFLRALGENNGRSVSVRTKQIVAEAMLASLVVLSCGQSARRLAAATTDGQAATRDNVLSYIRETYVVPDSVKLTLGPFRDSATPGYYDCTVTADDGKQPRTQNISVS